MGSISVMTKVRHELTTQAGRWLTIENIFKFLRLKMFQSDRRGAGDKVVRIITVGAGDGYTPVSFVSRYRYTSYTSVTFKT